DRKIMGELIKVNQATDQAWVEGPGMSTQLAARGLLTDKAPEEDDEAEASTSQEAEQPTKTLVSTSNGPARDGNRRNATQGGRSNLTQHSTARPGDSPAQSAKPKTRGGVPLSDKVPLTITWTKRMEFMGRATDLEGRPAAKAIFYGQVAAVMEDARLQCEDHMITYADRVIPLTKFGSLSDQKRRSGA